MEFPIVNPSVPDIARIVSAAMAAGAAAFAQGAYSAALVEQFTRAAKREHLEWWAMLQNDVDASRVLPPLMARLREPEDRGPQPRRQRGGTPRVRVEPPAVDPGIEELLALIADVPYNSKNCK